MSSSGSMTVADRSDDARVQRAAFLARCAYFCMAMIFVCLAAAAAGTAFAPVDTEFSRQSAVVTNLVGEKSAVVAVVQGDFGTRYQAVTGPAVAVGDHVQVWASSVDTRNAFADQPRASGMWVSFSAVLFIGFTLAAIGFVVVYIKYAV